MQRYNFFDISQLGQVEQTTQYAVYNRTRQELVHRHGVCYAGLPSFWQPSYTKAEALLKEAVNYYPKTDSLTIIKRAPLTDKELQTLSPFERLGIGVPNDIFYADRCDTPTQSSNFIRMVEGLDKVKTNGRRNS